MREQARELRAAGRSVREIEMELGVARSSVSRWVRDIQLTEAQLVALAARVGAGRLRVAQLKADQARAIRLGYQTEGRQRARSGSPRYMAGCMLYWAEGSKSRGSVEMSNSDTELLRFFATFLRTEFAVENASMRVHCQLFADHISVQREIERRWLDALSLPESCLRKTTVNSYSKHSQKKRKNKLPFGTCKLVVHNTRIAQTIYGSIQEYGGFERAAWLD